MLEKNLVTEQRLQEYSKAWKEFANKSPSGFLNILWCEAIGINQ